MQSIRSTNRFLVGAALEVFSFVGVFSFVYLVAVIIYAISFSFET